MNRNRHTKQFYSRVVNTSKALQLLDKKGCAIISLSINDRGNTIDILPPPANALKGVQTTINNDINGRSYSMLARIHGCNVVWKQDNLH